MRSEQDQALRLDDQNERARARARLLQAIDREPSRSGQFALPVGQTWWRRWGWAAGLAAGACTIAIVAGIAALGPFGSGEPDEIGPELATLEFQIAGIEIGVDQIVKANDRAELVAVSDSTEIELGPHAQMYVDAVRPNGASIVLDHGEIALAVHHEHDTSWQVEAGPWTVHVTGTEFVVAWEPSTEQFRVAVTEGSVRIEGPSDEVVELRAGDELVRPHPTLASEALPHPLADEPGEPLVLEPVDPVTPELGKLGMAKLSKPSVRTWIRHFDDANYKGAWAVLAEQPGGIHAEAERIADAETLLDLADVARFTKHPADTRKLLERLRDRFPSTHQAGDAAFTLGRLAADGGSQAQAAAWFERYLDERPTGSFAGDALARLIDCYIALGRDDDANSAAKRYLASHAKGPHASKAEKILAR